MGLKKRFIYVDDVNRFHLMCIKNENTNNEIFNIGSGESHSIKFIFENIANILGSDIKPIFGKTLTLKLKKI